ncbi:DUF1932 domain-containing protein [Pseudoxanthobacter sp.]|uniref:DUF1932 domain-containing protein n=1 Tax=Pseudoxanthobacter sp. TaxID=1925742 RepID=UPI002FDF7407
MSEIHAIAFIGYGEVGTLFARQLQAVRPLAVAAYDIKLDADQTAAPLRTVAAADGVRLAASAAEAAAGADVVFSAVTADQAESVALAARAWLKPGQMLFDVNSASPATKARAGAALAAAGLDYVEGAVMAPVAVPGIRVPVLSGGARAAALTEALNACGMNIRAVSGTIGRASATKLCRSIMIKGIEALIIESAAAAAQWGVSDDVFASLNATFRDADWAELAPLMDQRVARHGVRRAAEMREAAAMLADMGRPGDLALAVAAAHARRAGSK